MRKIKSERLRKLETELTDLEQWLKLGLVPKKDITKHKKEIKSIREKLGDEEERIRFLKESGDLEEYVTPKKGASRSGYTDMPTIPDIDGGETRASRFDDDTNHEISDNETTVSETKTEGDKGKEEEESYFSDKARWKRSSGIIDPDADDW